MNAEVEALKAQVKALKKDSKTMRDALLMIDSCGVGAGKAMKRIADEALTKAKLGVLTLNVTREWFEQAKSGEKKEEYRETTEYWKKRLIGKDGNPKEFSEIRYCMGYPSANDKERVLVFPWNGFEVKTITHKHFDFEEKEVFAIRLEKER